MIKEISFFSHDEIQVVGRIWECTDTAPKAVIQIAHGLGDKIERYDDFAKFLNSQGYVVYGHDHRGHGKTAATEEQVGFFSEKGGWSKVINDMSRVSEIAKADYPDLPLFIFGHSMGSFITRDFLRVKYDLIDGVILSGTAYHNPALIKLGSAIAKSEAKLRGKHHRSKLLDKMSFGSFNKHFKPNRTEFDWISRDNEQVDRYVSDPYCGIISTASLFSDLSKGLKSINNIDTLKKVPKDIPIFFIAGDNDPVGDFGKGVLKIFNRYNDLGFNDVSIKLYKGGRHEVLNEINRNEVYDDILSWLNNHL